ncbi:hypothetical protein [Enterococcus malodoratus]|uniref:Uncharacterized protein n=1 Tax=Enterococcus malodoratus ATCC 43197 TaxID=1158601 RepID=R2NM73_9ENTE|nr:hypothetical protein [Enterococcus malodoratus]EOH72083.1 hypothetical protein UAI_04367 [Enterococcus malodoratus ATCC 43197]EOT69893.1 hypothetical protein I585_01372 [Enterococcus malodoratus ATCC 43197]OJG64166.1 hypothetical protein RV07_GL000566 [Enterococcus malodoratus]SPX01518.1 Uncharacterised protein [Enterococcus malodoratus]STC70744.1 Uncharacterised protein [Enterococcus malodoratus]
MYSPFVPSDFDFLSEFAKFDQMIELDFETIRITGKDREIVDELHSVNDEMQIRKMVSEEYLRKRQEKLNEAGDITIE